MECRKKKRDEAQAQVHVAQDDEQALLLLEHAVITPTSAPLPTPALVETPATLPASTPLEPSTPPLAIVNLVE